MTNGSVRPTMAGRCRSIMIHTTSSVRVVAVTDARPYTRAGPRKQTTVQRSAERLSAMIDELARYLMSQRTLSAAEVDARAHARDLYDLTPAERLDNVTSRPVSTASQH